MGKNQSVSRDSDGELRTRMRNLLLKSNFVDLVASAIPKDADTTPHKIVWSAFTVIEKPDPRDGSRKLLHCTDASIKRAILQAASIGFEFGGPRPTCWMIPRGGDATYQTAAHGYITLAYRCGMKRVSADVIYEADDYRLIRGEQPRLEHEITKSFHLPGRNIPIGAFEKAGIPLAKGGAGRPLAAYVVAWDAEGLPHWGYVSEQECIAARDVSSAKNSGAHLDWGDQMRIRTAISRARKLWPDASLIHKALGIDEENDLDEKLEQALRDEAAIDTDGFDAQKHAADSIVERAKKNGNGSPKALKDKSLSARERLGAETEPEPISAEAEPAQQKLSEDMDDKQPRRPGEEG
jgi:recombinational DNA repair protein RecT